MDFKSKPGGLGDKFRLLYTVATDERASRSDAAVLAVVLWRYNPAHGCCWPSVESLAEDAGVDARTAQRALERLEAWGYLHTIRQRGKLNRYIPHFQTQRAPGSNGTRATPDPRHPRPRPPASVSERNGMGDVPPPASTPPEYLNESIPNLKKEKEPDGKSDFSFEGIGKESQKPRASPETKLTTRIGILRMRRDMGAPLRELQEQLEGCWEQYHQDCHDAGMGPGKPGEDAINEARREFAS